MKLGIIGGGQLGRMLALAAYPLGIQSLVLDPDSRCPAGQVAPQISARFDNLDALRRLEGEVDFLTYEFENLPAEALQLLTPSKLNPNLEILKASQDRWLEKKTFTELKIPTTRFQTVEDEESLEKAVQEVGLPCVLKTRRMGYDGKGQRILRHRDEIKKAWNELGQFPLLVENWVDFSTEVSQIAARDQQGNIVYYPLTQNFHQKGILRESLAPFEDSNLSKQAQQYLKSLLETFNYVGVLAVEFFVLHNEYLIANEMAPRVHNSGHWTLEGAITSQFENHVRAVCGLPLGASASNGCSAMLNLISTMPDKKQVLAVSPQIHYHDYGKQPRSDRKLGHLTVVEKDLQSLIHIVEELRKLT